tara:strand:+ start:3781 stop:5142 length:1362 start_codon:yes stop_codon:yes gene_type:complete
MLRPFGFLGSESAPGFDNTYSLDFDGVNDYVDLGTTISALRPTGAFSISLWAKWSSVSGLRGLWTCGTNTGQMIWTNGTSLQFYIYTSGGWVAATSSVTIATGQWYHIGCTWDGSGTSTIYVDGSSTGTASPSDITYAATTYHNIGRYISNEFNGLIDEVSFWHSELSSGDISTLYNSGTPNNLNTALATTPIIWYRMGDSGTFFNSNWEIPEQTKINNWSSHSFDFDGIDGTIDCGNDNSLDLVGTDFSVSFWIKPDTTHNGLILDRYLSGDGWGVYDNSGTLKFYDGVTFRTFSPSISLTNGVWQHILITGNTATNTLSCYKDGGSASSVTFSAITSVTDNFIIGSQHGTGFYFNGKMDEISIFDSIKAVADVNDGTKPIDLTGESGLIGWWRSEDATFSTNWSVPDNSSNSNDGTSSGMAIDDKVNNAPDNINQGLTSGMVEGDRVEDTP